MNLIDTHAHMYSESFNEDLPSIMKDAAQKGISLVLLPNVDVSSIAEMERVYQAFPDQTRMMMGLHPTEVKENWKQEVDTIINAINPEKHIAVGEIGIDLYWDKTLIKEQIQAFELQVEAAIQYNLPISIHARDAFDEVFTSLKKFRPSQLSGSFHSFTGNKEHIDVIKTLGNFKLGINGVVTFKNSGLDKQLAHTNLNNIMYETDAPYLTPTPYRGKRNEPAYIALINAKIASIFNCSEEHAAEITTKNATEIFNL